MEMLKKFITMIMIIAMLALFAGCGNTRTINDKYCDTYGLLNSEFKCEGVRYRVIVGNIIWGVILAGTIVAPIYFFGFSLYEPVSAGAN